MDSVVNLTIQVKFILCSITHSPVKTYGVVHKFVVSRFICRKRAPCIYRVGRWVVRMIGLNTARKSKICVPAEIGTQTGRKVVA